MTGVDDDLIGTREASRILGCSKSNVCHLVRKGRLASVTPAPYTVARSEVWAFLQRRHDAHRSHGPECPISTADLWEMHLHECQCTRCHCGDLHQPGGEFNTCRRCLRKRTEDLHLWKAAS